MKLLNQFSRFLAVGGLATLIHYGVLVALVQLFGIDPVMSSAVGFIVSALANYGLNYRFTFRASGHHRHAMARFAAVAGSGLTLNTALMWLLSELMSLHYIISQILATGLVLIWNFMLHRHWTFASPR